MTPTDAASVEIYLRLNNNVVHYFDGAMLVKGEAPDEVVNHGGYWAGDSYERVIDVTNTDVIAAGLSSAAQTSITDYGIREDTESSSAVVDYATAVAWAVGNFNANAVPSIPSRMTLLEPKTIPNQGGSIRIVNLVSSPPALFPSRLAFTISTRVQVEVELGNQRPDMAQLIQATAIRAAEGLG
jgi:hypothetical protein